MLSAFTALVFGACAPAASDLEVGFDPEEGSFSGDLPDSLIVDPAQIQPFASFGPFTNVEVPEQEDDPQPVADSITDFTSVQGMNNWWYGYIEPKGTNTFTQAEVYVANGADPGWYALPDGQTWTFMDADTMHPNGETTTGGREPLEQWAARRWVSTVEGNLRITGELSKYYVDGTSSGVAGYVYVDGVMVWAWYIEGWDNTGVTFDKTLPVAVGSTVDFMLDPWESDDRSDRSVFTSQMFTAE